MTSIKQMKHRAKHLVAICCVWIGVAGLLHARVAQESLKVLAVRGNVTLAGGAKLSVGQQLAISDRVTVGSGGYASITHPNGRTAELKTPSTVTVRDLHQRLSKSTSSASSKFASYVASELTETSEPIAFRSKRRGNMKTTGSVERAAGDDVNAVDTVLRVVGAPGEVQALADLSSAKIEREGRLAVVMPRTTRLLSDTVTFTWRRTPKWDSYRLVILNRANAAVVTRETGDTAITLPLASLGIAPGELYSWRVEAKTQPSERTAEYGLWLLDGADEQQTRGLLDEIASGQDDPASAISLMIRAAAQEDLGLIYDAYNSYRRVVQLEPEVQSYRRAFAEFLVRQTLTIEAYSVYEAR